MQICAKKPIATQQTKSAKSPDPSRSFVGQSHNVRSTLHLYRAIGNHTFLRLMNTPEENINANSANRTSTGVSDDFNHRPIYQSIHDPIQPKLKVNAPKDHYEQEADRIADEVLRQKMPGEDERLAIQAKASQQTTGSKPEVNEEIEDRLSRSKGSGNPISDQLRAFVGPRMQFDFSKVRIHSDNEAAWMNQALGAQAFTHGRDIYFGAGQYNPQSTAGKRLLVHELTHTIQQGISSSRQGQYVQRSPYRTAQQRGQSGNPINVAVQTVKNHYSGIGATLLTNDLVAGIIYAEGEINTDLTDVIGDWLETSGTVGPGQLSSGAIQQVDASIPQKAHQQFETQFGAAPATWREKAEHDQWAFFYTAGYLAWCISEAARLFQAVDGADSHIPLGFAYYQGAFNTARDLRRRIARERGIANTDVTWEMVEAAAGRGASKRLSPKERRVFNYVQLGAGGFDFEFQIDKALESRSFHIPEGHVKVYCSANYVDSSITPGSEDSYYIQLLEFRTTGQGAHYRVVKHDRVRFPMDQRRYYEWTGLFRASTYALQLTNESSNEISGEGEVVYLY